MTDPELEAMRTLVEALDPLDVPQRRRILKWAWARFVPRGILFPSDSLTDWSEPADNPEDIHVDE
ncbi:MAG: hypothetical protein J2P28_10940 [Actinobacteria bacterium]|nr:hypothetical protein [Actinomycetota bacterium]